MSENFNIDDISNLASIELSEDEKIDIHPLSKVLELRKDESKESVKHEDAMMNSPETKDGHFVVPPSIE